MEQFGVALDSERNSSYKSEDINPLPTEVHLTYGDIEEYDTDSLKMRSKVTKLNK